MIRQGIGMGRVVILIGMELGQWIMERVVCHAQVRGEHARLVAEWLTFLLGPRDGGCWLGTDLRLLERGEGVLRGGGGGGGGGLDRGGVTAGVVGGGAHKGGPGASVGPSAEGLEANLHLLDLEKKRGKV